MEDLIITLTFNQFMKFCAAFTAICVAGGWAAKILAKAISPVVNAKRKLTTADARLDDLESTRQEFADAIALMLETNMAVLNHLRTDNNTGVMAELEKKIDEFLIKSNFGGEKETEE